LLSLVVDGITIRLVGRVGQSVRTWWEDKKRLLLTASSPPVLSHLLGSDAIALLEALLRLGLLDRGGQDRLLGWVLQSGNLEMEGIRPCDGMALSNA